VKKGSREGEAATMVTKSQASQGPSARRGPDVHDRAPDGARKFRSLRLGWTDPESGDEMVVDVRGPDSFLQDSLLPGIEEHGFVVLSSVIRVDEISSAEISTVESSARTPRIGARRIDSRRIEATAIGLSASATRSSVTRGEREGARATLDD
jgi:hypothetical protein